jgi:hypothetical protein
MAWTTLTFGKHRGKTLPQVIALDLDWFLHMAPKLYGALGKEASKLSRRLQAIRIPRNVRHHVVEYLDRDGHFCRFLFVKQGKPRAHHISLQLPHLDLSVAALGRGYAKGECRRMIDCFRRVYFGENKRLSKRRCERFFDDPRNFVNP